MIGKIQVLNIKSDTANEMTNGVVTCLRKGKWFKSEKIVIKLKVMPKKAKNVAALPAKMESMAENAKSFSVPWHIWSVKLDMLSWTN